MITNRDDYMKFRLGTFSKEGDEPEKKEGEEKETQTETPAEGGETKTEEKSGEAPKEGELETHSFQDAVGTVFGAMFMTVIGAFITKFSKGVGGKTAGIGLIISTLLFAVLSLINEKKYRQYSAMLNELQDIRQWLKEVRDGNISIESGDVEELAKTFTNMATIIEKEANEGKLSVGDIDAMKTNLHIAQEEAKRMGLEVNMQSYSKMKVYSKVDTIKAALYLDELGWEKVTPNGYLVPGTDQMIKIWTDENTDDTMTEVDGAEGKVIGVQQSFEDFKDFVDRLIRNGVGSYSDEDEQSGAIEIAESRDEQGYSEDEIADKAEELEKEVEELKKEVAELKGEEPKSEETKPEGETATNSDGICPECGKVPCECVKPEGELETKSDFATRLMEKLNRG